ncbi:endo/excinuclease amino terminal domain /phosphoribosylformimino-5-aminoimidazole carboxamide ribotide isomerase [Algibacter lectus]|uniref:Endo/excinuclease amino terminal domain /phosphoribosylformimino-5-aminoimidazole carboxamide ribotide isomerase n=1 Tax=Algibacter lectus TaxID=221126 RepID=A0A090WNA0_9FLAO|nr:endo/excinuclease amino terminal domain /phosphoribosylformimino-5-aminoimidazole carboxamide ribotide isomerase [Algibacter lectus]
MTDLIYFEAFFEKKEAKAREKQLKNWHKEWKWNLIKEANPELKSIMIN